MKCPCGSDSDFEMCCGPFLAGQALPDTAEKLMRSRYTAYTRANIEYLKMTMTPEGRKDFDAATTEQWAKGSKWKGLKILDTEKGMPEDITGVVEFIATYEQAGEGVDHHEVSQFRKSKDGQWLFVDGEGHQHKEGEGHQHGAPKTAPVVREGSKIGRNDPCPCGSGKKFKKCCEGKSD
jgi:SEC-C motif domain protein